MAVNMTNGFADNCSADDFEEVSIPMPWGHINGKWWGSKEQQPIIAIHGWQDNAGTWDNLAPYLCKKTPLLCIDLPGHGRSSHYPKGQFYYIFWDGILILRRIVQHYKFKKIKILGHSLGGAIAFLYAGSFPGEVDSYISIDIASPSVRDSEKMVLALGDSVDKYLKYETLPKESQPNYDYEEMLNILFDAHGGSVSRECCQILMKRGVKPADKPGTYLFARDPRLKVPILGYMIQDQVLQIATKITCKVLNIRADPGLKFPHPEEYDECLDVIEKTAEKMVRIKVPGTHHLHLNDPESVVGPIRKFLSM